MTTFVLFGGTGDLAKRKIIPALYSAFVNERLDADFKLVAAAREPLSDEVFRESVVASIAGSDPDAKAAGTLGAFLQRVYYVKIDAREATDFAMLKSLLDGFQSNATLFYLAKAPDMLV